jgi:hypothetical protein
MSMDSESPSEKPTKPIRRFGTGFLSLVQVLCFTLLFVAANYLGSRHYATLDLSEEASYTLSPATRRYLESPAIRDRAEPVRLLVAFRRVNPMYEKVRVLAEEYTRLSGGKVRLELVDPVRSPDRTQQLADEYGKIFRGSFNKSMFTTDLAIVDARTAPEKEAAPAAAGAANPHIRFVEAETMARFETDPNGKRKVTGFLGEDALTTGLVAAIEGKPRVVYFLSDKSGFASDGADSPLATFEGTLLTRNVLTEHARISALDRIPDEAAALAILNPVYDFTPAELEVLAEYWNRPRSALLVTLGSSDTPPRLRAFLRNLGITPGRDRVITKNGDQVVTTVRGKFEPGMEFTRDLWGKVATFEGSTTSLEIRARDNDDLIERRIFPYTLLSAEPEFWGETRFSTEDQQFDPREDNRGSLADDKVTFLGLPLAGAVIRGAATRDDIGEEISRMVVIANSDFLAPRYFSDINKDFLSSSLNWLIGREQLAGAGPRTLGTYKLPLLDSQLSFINRINLFFLPAFALAIGALVWSSRRA